MSDPTNQTIAETVKTLRKRLGWSQGELARRAEFDHHQTVSEIERGKRSLKAAELVRLATLFRVEVADLLMGRVPPEGRPVLWREEPAEGLRKEIENVFLQRCRRYAFVERLAGMEGDAAIPQYTLDLETEDFSRVESMADQVRGALDLGETPGPALREMLEERWRVKILPALLDEGSAATAWEDFGPAILENIAEPPGRRVFSLAHELFHILTWKSFHELSENERRSAHRRNERAANAFASALLLPAPAVRQTVARHTIEQMVDLLPVARAFDVTQPALLWRMVNLGMLEKDAVRGFLDPDSWWGETVPGWEPPETLEEVFPPRFVNLAFSVYVKGRISIGKFAELLETTVGMLPRTLAQYGLDIDRHAYETKVRPA